MKTIVVSVDELKDIINETLDEQLKPLKQDLRSLRGETVYSVRQVAEKLGKDKTTIYKYCSIGRIEAVRRGHTYTISQTALEDYITGNNKKK